MKIIFMGTPDFAVPTLEALVEAGHQVGYVISQPDAKRDRGKKIKATKVKEKAMELGLSVIQPEKIKGNEELIKTLKKYNPDVLVVVAYGKILPVEMLDIAKKCALNVHGSLLPKFRGAAPIQRAILEGEEKTGITIMEIGQGLDTGDMLAKEEILIGRQNKEELFHHLSVVGAKLLVKVLANLDTLLAQKEQQNEKEATYAAMIYKEDEKINFTRSSKEIDCQIRAMAPKPGAYAIYNGEKIKLFDPEGESLKQSEGNGERHQEPGQVLDVSKEGIRVKTGDGSINIRQIQMPGKKKMAVRDFMAGNNIEINTILE